MPVRRLTQSRAFSRVPQFFGAAVLGTLVLTMPTAAHAQFGKLKKMGADAIKDAAKDKIGADKKEPAGAAATASTSAAKPAKEAGMPKLDADRIQLVLTSLTPQLKAAQIRADAAAATSAYQAKKKASDACIENFSKSANPMAIAASAEKNEAKIAALQTQSEAAQRRFNAAMQSNDIRKQVFLEDTTTVLLQRMALLSYGATCTVDFAPVAMLEAKALERQGRRGDDAGQFDPGDATRKAMSRTEYGVLRERIALWTLMQSNPTLKGTGKEGIFSPEEQSALGQFSGDLMKFAPLFKADAMIWRTWSDLRDW